MYGQTNIDAMPDYADYDLWDQYMGRLWFGLIESTRLQPDATIIEVAPGATAKISYALSNFNFCGRLYIIEPHPQVAQIIYDKSLKLLTNAEIIMLPEGFQTVRISGPVDAIVANHPFDDFLSAYATQMPESQAILFQDISKEDDEVLAILRQTWQCLENAPEKLAFLKQQVQSDWHDFVEHHHPEVMILSQYASSYFEKHGMGLINAHAKAVFQRIARDCKNPKTQQSVQAILNRNENYHNHWIGEELLCAENWLIDEPQYEM